MMKRCENKILIIFIMLISCSLISRESFAKKIKNTFKIEKTQSVSPKVEVEQINGQEICLVDFEGKESREDSINILGLRKIGFAGYDKEVNSSKESFIITNGSEELLVGVEIRIDYFDMSDRMLHSRTVRKSCYVPPGENRRLDISSWDKQHTFYYYLGNPPKKIATPFKVSIVPIKFWIE